MTALRVSDFFTRSRAATSIARNCQRGSPLSSLATKRRLCKGRTCHPNGPAKLVYRGASSTPAGKTYFYDALPMKRLLNNEAFAGRLCVRSPRDCGMSGTCRRSCSEYCCDPANLVRSEGRRRVYFLAAYLLRRHVPRGAQNHARHGVRRDSRRGSLCSLCAGFFYSRHLCQPEVEHLQPPIFGDEYVFRFQVAMHHAFVMRCGKPLGELRRIFDRLPLRHRGVVHFFAQGLTVEKLADHIRRSLVLPDVVHAENVGMIQRRDRARFLLEAPQPVGITRKRLRQNFDGYLAVEARVAGTIHLSHAAGAQRRLNFIRPEFGTRGEGHER